MGRKILRNLREVQSLRRNKCEYDMSNVRNLLSKEIVGIPYYALSFEMNIQE